MLRASKQEFTSEVWSQCYAGLKWIFLGIMWCSWPLLMLPTKHHAQVTLNACITHVYDTPNRVLLEWVQIQAVMKEGLLVKVHIPLCCCKEDWKWRANTNLCICACLRKLAGKWRWAYIFCPVTSHRNMCDSGLGLRYVKWDKSWWLLPELNTLNTLYNNEELEVISMTHSKKLIE